MRIFLSVLVLIFSLQSWTKADDIRDFEIEGMSIGDSALEHFEKDQLINDNTYYYKNNKYAGVILFDNFEIYDDIQITFDPKDKDLKIVDIKGSINFKQNIEDCYSMQKKIIKDLDKMFSHLEKSSYEQPHRADKTGNSIGNATEFEFKNGDSIRVICMNWSEEITEKNNWWDNLGVSVATDTFLNFITNEAYN